MDRAGAYALARASGMDPLMLQVGRTLTDTPDGYAPAIDRSLVIYRAGRPDAVLVPPTVVADSDVGVYDVVLRACIYDLVLPGLAVQVDVSVDAPLTSAKFSQAYRAIRDMRDAAWKQAGDLGFGDGGNTTGFKLNMNHLDQWGTYAEHEA